jgi:dTMP kinase
VLITIEGIDGAGKTTLARALGDALGATVLREPGGVETDPALAVDPHAEALLYAAARAQLVAERIRPLLARGETLVLDRFVDSSLAYQGAGRGLGTDRVRAMNDFGVTPDVTFLLRLDPAAARARLGGEPRDRLEREPEAFFATIAAAYDDLAASEPARFRVLDATLAPGDVLTAALAALGET